MSYDYEKMTKDELISWIKTQFYARLPRTSEVLFIRWKKGCAKLRDRERLHVFPKGAAEQDELSRQFNASKCIDEKLEIMKRMKPFHDALGVYLKESKLIDKQRERIDRLYEKHVAAYEAGD